MKKLLTLFLALTGIAPFLQGMEYDFRSIEEKFQRIVDGCSFENVPREVHSLFFQSMMAPLKTASREVLAVFGSTADHELKSFIEQAIEQVKENYEAQKKNKRINSLDKHKFSDNFDQSYIQWLESKGLRGQGAFSAEDELVSVEALQHNQLLQFAIERRDESLINSLLASNECNLSLLQLWEKDSWFLPKLQFVQQPNINALVVQDAPGARDLFVEFDELKLASRADLCEYIAYPERYTDDYITKHGSLAPQRRFSDQQTVLMWACIMGYTKQLRKILGCKLPLAFINAQDAAGNTALDYAVQKANLAPIAWLLQAGAVPSMRTLAKASKAYETSKAIRAIISRFTSCETQKTRHVRSKVNLQARIVTMLLYYLQDADRAILFQ